MGLSKEREGLIGRLKVRRTREREGLFLVEGIRSTDEALSSGAKLKFAVVSPRLGALRGGGALKVRLARAHRHGRGHRRRARRAVGHRSAPGRARGVPRGIP